MDERFIEIQMMVFDVSIIKADKSERKTENEKRTLRNI